MYLKLGRLDKFSERGYVCEAFRFRSDMAQVKANAPLWFERSNG